MWINFLQHFKDTFSFWRHISPVAFERFIVEIDKVDNYNLKNLIIFWRETIAIKAFAWAIRLA